MLLLKGENYKSVVLNQLMRNEFNECIVWDEQDVYVKSSWHVDSNDIDHLYECITELNDSLFVGGENRDLLLIYTNKTEEEISSLIEWIKNKERFYLQFRQVLVTCK